MEGGDVSYCLTMKTRIALRNTSEQDDTKLCPYINVVNGGGGGHQIYGFMTNFHKKWQKMTTVFGLWSQKYLCLYVFRNAPISSTSPPPFTLVLTPQNMFINNLPPTIMAYSHDDTTTIERWCSFKPGTNTRPPYRILALWRKLSPRFIIPITVYHHLSAQTHAQGAAAIFRQQLNYWTTILCNTIQILTQLESLFLK